MAFPVSTSLGVVSSSLEMPSKLLPIVFVGFSEKRRKTEHVGEGVFFFYNGNK